MEDNEAEERIDPVALIEAALYVSGRPLDLKTLSSILRTKSTSRIRSVMRVLLRRYERTGGALELLELEDQRFVLQLRPEYVERVRRLASRPLLTPGPLKTLSFIAYNQPVAQSRVIEVRGTGAYSHVGLLAKLGLVDSQDLGKTKMLRTTGIFADYFNLSHNQRLQKRQLDALFKQLGESEEVKVNESQG